ncbi:MAG: hypothetical protein GX446_08010 [Chthonomonadales bacterium]|nr:hypothetical protein [Chthonomonadales bacterium]
MPVKGRPSDRASRNREDGLETALMWAARWTPERQLRPGVLSDAVTRRGQSRGLESVRRPRGRLVAAASALALVLAVSMWITANRAARTARTGPDMQAASSAGAPALDVTAPTTPRADIKQSAPSGAVRMAEGSPNTAGVQADGGSSHRRSRQVATASARQTARLRTSPPESKRSREGVRWRKYTVPRYVAGVSTGGWLAGSAGDGDGRVIPVMVDVPLAVGYGDPGDTDLTELDVIPVQHILEEYDEPHYP